MQNIKTTVVIFSSFAYFVLDVLKLNKFLRNNSTMWFLSEMLSYPWK